MKSTSSSQTPPVELEGEVSTPYSETKLYDAIERMLSHAATTIPEDIIAALQAAAKAESNALAKKQLEAIMTSIDLSNKLQIPLCQDTGLVTLFVSGHLVNHLSTVRRALVRALESMTARSMMRPNVVHPLTRNNTGTNTGLDQPEVVIDDSTDETEMKLLLKGAGTENHTNLRMMSPTASLRDVFEHILRVVTEAGGKVCPPTIIGIGIGGSSVKALQNSKLALLRPIGQRHPDAETASLESHLLQAINELGVGTMGLGGDTTALDVKIEVAGTHTASLPVAISFGCWANRLAEAVLRDTDFQIVR